MIKTRIFKFVGHIHNMLLCIEMISFINHENESIIRWFSGLFSRILCPVAGCIQTGWGSDLWLPAVVLWNSAPHVSTMLRSNLDLSDSVLDMLHSVKDDVLFWSRNALHELLAVLLAAGVLFVHSRECLHSSASARELSFTETRWSDPRHRTTTPRLCFNHSWGL